MTSAIALLMGRVDAPFTSSAPSATNHVALSCRPHSLNRVERSTPVHSALLHVLVRRIGAVCNTLDEMEPGDRRETSQVRHGENPGPVHQAVNHQSVLR